MKGSGSRSARASVRWRVAEGFVCISEVDFDFARVRAGRKKKLSTFAKSLAGAVASLRSLTDPLARLLLETLCALLSCECPGF